MCSAITDHDNINNPNLSSQFAIATTHIQYRARTLQILTIIVVLSSLINCCHEITKPKNSAALNIILEYIALKFIFNDEKRIRFNALHELNSLNTMHYNLLHLLHVQVIQNTLVESRAHYNS